MSVSAQVQLRQATTADLPAIAALRESVGWNVHDWALRAVIGQPRATCLVATDADGSVAGVGSGISYGALGFVGNMVVAATHRRRGIGATILEAVIAFLEDAGCRRLELYSTQDGRPLYRRYGFELAGQSVMASIPRDRLVEPAGVELRRLGTGDHAALLGYDAPRFGGDRGPLLAMMLADPDRPVVAAMRDGAIVGYAWERLDGGRLGPFLADSPDVAAALAADAFRRVPHLSELTLNLPAANGPGRAWLGSLGVDVDPWDGRMGRGPQVPRRDETIYANVVGALG